MRVGAEGREDAPRIVEGVANVLIQQHRCVDFRHLDKRDVGELVVRWVGHEGIPDGCEVRFDCVRHVQARRGAGLERKSRLKAKGLALIANEVAEARTPSSSSIGMTTSGPWSGKQLF